jgi:transcriptional regulator with XRE-family HTH domain
LLEDARQLAFEDVIDLTYVAEIERGRRDLSLLVDGQIADALSVALPKLLSEETMLAGLSSPSDCRRVL